MSISAFRAKSPADLSGHALDSEKAAPRLPHATASLQSLGGNHAVTQLLGRGDALPDHVRVEMERRFGTRFEDVRIHTDPLAHAVAGAFNAKALTHGSTVVFGPNRYNPGSHEGKHLLAHELAHVVQQRRGGLSPGHRASFNESAADSAAGHVAYGSGPVAVEGASAVGVARAELNESAGTDDETGVMLNRFRRFLLDAIVSGAQQHGSSGDVLLAKAIEGVSDECFQELWVEGRGKALLLKLVGLGPLGVAKAFAGYQVGVAEGLASPLTDLFGMAVFGESARNLLWGLAQSVYNSADQLGPEIQALLQKSDALARSTGDALSAFATDPDALQTLLALPQAANDYAQTKAYELGRAGASRAVSALESPWAMPEAAAAPAPEFGVSTALSWMQSKAQAVHDWGIASPGAKLGEAAGYAMGWVAMQVILVACTAGASGALEAAGSALARLGAVVSRVSPTAGTAVIGAARLVTLLAEVTGALGEALNALQDAALQPLRKALARILDPLRDLLTSLEALIDRVRLAAARGESGRIEMSSEELVRRIRGPAPRTSAAARPAPIRGGAGVDDDATEIFEPEAKKKLIAEAQVRASLKEDWPEIDAPAEQWTGLDPQDAPTEELSAEASARLRLEARERAGAQPAGSQTTPNADAAAAAEATDRPGRNWKQFAPEGESTPPAAYNVNDKSFGPAASGQDENAERWLKRPDYEDTPAAPGEHEIGVASEASGEVRSQPGEMIEADVPDTELREVLSREPLARSYGIEKPPPTEYNELIESAGTTRRAEVEPNAWDAAHPGETRRKEFGGGDAGRETGFSKYEDGRDASVERTSGQTLVPDEQLEVPDRAMQGPNDPDQIRLEQEEREAWSEDWPTSRDQPPSKNPPKHRRVWFKGKRRKD